MKRLKRILSLILVWSILLGLTVSSASAANQISVSMDTVSTANQGSTFTVDVKATDSKEKVVGSVGLYIYYKEEVLECSAFSAGTLLNGAQTNPKANIPSNNPKYKEGYAAATLSYAATSGTNVDGILGTLTFKVKDGLESCTTDIQVVAEFSDTTVGTPGQIAADVTGAKEITIKGVPPTIGTVELSNTDPIQVDNSEGKTVSAKATSTKDKDITSQVAWSVDPADGKVSIAADGTITVAKDAKAGNYAIIAGAKDGESQLGESATAPSATLTVERDCKATTIEVYKTIGGTTTQITGDTDSIAIPRGDTANAVTYSAKVLDQFGVEIEDDGKVEFTGTIPANVTINNDTGKVSVPNNAGKGSFSLTATSNSNRDLAGKVVTISVEDIDFSKVSDVTYTVKPKPTYGDTWEQIITNISGSMPTVAGRTLSGRYEVKNKEATPAANNTTSPTTNIAIVFVGEGDDVAYKDIDVPASAIAAADKTVAIGRKELAITWGNYEVTYNGAAQKPTATVNDGQMVGTDTKPELTVTVADGTDKTDAGTYSAKAALPAADYDNYVLKNASADGTVLRDFVIKPAPVTLTTTTPITIKAIYANDATSNVDLNSIATYANSETATATVTGTYATNKTVQLTVTWACNTPQDFVKTGKTYNLTAQSLTPSDVAAANLDLTKVTMPTATVEVKKVEATLALAANDQEANVKAAAVATVDALSALLPETVDATYTAAASVPADTLKINGWQIDKAANLQAIVDAAKALKDDDAALVYKLTPTFTTEGTNAIAPWITLPDTKPTFTLTITPKTPVDITVTGTNSYVYGTAVADTNFTGAQEKIGEGDTDTSDTVSYTYSYEGTGTTKYGPSAAAPTDAGSYKVTLTLVSKTHSGKGELAFTITAKPLADGMIGTIGDQTYDGQEHEPELTVKDGEKTLVKDTDYTVAYTNNINAAKSTDANPPKVTITGKGNYSGDATATFTIQPKPLSLKSGDTGNTTVTGLVAGGYTYTGKAIQPKVNVAVDGIGNLVENTDYTLEYGENKNAGDEAGVIKITGKGNFSTTTPLEVKFKINPAELTGTVSITHTDSDSDKKINKGDKLTADISKLNAKEADLTFQWYKGTAAIDGADKKDYTLDESDTEGTVYVKVTAAPNKNFTGSVDSNKVEIAKKPMPTDVTVSISATADNNGKVTVTANVTVTTGEGATTVGEVTNNFVVRWYCDGAQVGTDQAIEAAEAGSASPFKAVECPVTTLEPGKTYTCAVVPKDAAAEDGYTGETPATGTAQNAPTSSTSPVTGASVLSVPAKAPTVPTVTATPGNGQVALSWGAIAENGSQITSLVLSYTSSSGSGSVTLTPGDTTCTVTGLTNSTEYTFTLTATNGAGDGTATATATPKAPTTPTDPTPGKPGNTGSSSGSSGGGSSSSSTSVTVKHNNNGTITADLRNAKKGDTVTLTVRPKKGYELDTLTVTDKNGREIDVRAGRKDNTFTFTMPEGKVNVEATYKREGSSAGQPGGSNPFYDVSSTSPFYDAILWAYQTGITGGTTDTTFAPGNACTRAQTVTFLWRAAGSPSPRSTVNPFTDIQEGSYYYDAVLWAVEEGITNGLSATTFGPGATVNRGQVVTFLYRSAKAGAVDAGNPFTDVANDAYYAGPVQWAVVNGITNGTSATTFAPGSPCTRGQIVTFLYRHFA